MSTPPRRPPQEPNNPFPRPDASLPDVERIFDTTWKHFLSLFVTYEAQGFEQGNWMNDQPAGGDLHNLVNEIEAAIIQMKTAGPDRWFSTDNLTKLISHAPEIKNAVCVGLGGGFIAAHNLKGRRSFVWQYAFFRRVCELIEQKQKMKINSLPRVFQDPGFRFEEEYILNNLLHERIIWHPAATEVIDSYTFVYAPHLPWEISSDMVFQQDKHPAILIGNRIDDGAGSLPVAIAKIYVRQYYMTHDPMPSNEVQELRRQGRLFVDSYRGEDLVVQISTTWNPKVHIACDDFNDTWVYIRR